MILIWLHDPRSWCIKATSESTMQGFIMASQAWQKWVELKITYRVSVIDVWDWEITVQDWKITTWDYKITVWEIKSALREWKNVMRDHNYQSRVKNCHVRSILTVDNEKSLCEKKKSPFETIRGYRLVFFWAGETYPVSGEYFGGIFSYPVVSIKHGLRTTDYGLRTTDYGLGIKYGLRYKTRTENYGLSIKYEERFYIEYILARTFL